MKTVSILAVCLLVHFALAQIPGHQVFSIPNYEGPINFNQYAGYITVNQQHGRALFYWFVESQNDPANDPVVLWLNGGPGCSSLDGFLYEHGPFHFDRSGTGNIFATNDTLHQNPLSWNKVANVLYLEAPAGVGFSYSNTTSDYNTNDNKTAEDNYQFLVNFFDAYPSFASNEFYVSGESYAGIYVPTLAYYIHEQNAIASNPKINLKGILVGNGVTDENFDAVSYYQFAFDHALYSPNLYDKLVAGNCLVYNAPLSCLPLLIQLRNEVGNVNIYDIYKNCYEGETLKEFNYSPLRMDFDQFGARVSPPCINSAAATTYLNLAAVRSAIHALPASQIGPWEICSDKVNYKKLYTSVVSAYAVLCANYRVLVYSGDVDGAVPYLGTIEWIRQFENGATPLVDWQAWTQVDGVASYATGTQQVAGYVTKYSNLNFVTVRGAGHMVPQYKPAEGFAMFKGFLGGTFP